MPRSGQAHDVGNALHPRLRSVPLPNLPTQFDSTPGLDEIGLWQRARPFLSHTPKARLRIATSSGLFANTARSFSPSTDAAEPPSLFSKKGFYGTLMEWAMRDEHFKTQLFRFVDVLPTLSSSGEVARHLTGISRRQTSSSSPLPCGSGLKAAGGARGCFGAGVKAQVTGHGAAVHARQ